MDVVYKIINNISDRTYKECLKASFDTFHRVTNEGLLYAEGCVTMMCIYGEFAGHINPLESAYIKNYVEEKSKHDYKRYLDIKKHK